MKKTKLFLIGLGLGLWAVVMQGRPGIDPVAFSVVPKPEKITILRGDFETSQKPVLVVQNQDADGVALAAYLVERWKETTGDLLELMNRRSGRRPRATVSLKIVRSLERLGAEGYRLDIAPRAIEISALKPAGLFYGIQSICQMMRGTERIPCARIEDKPRFGWRGLLLDCGRHFMTVDFIKRIIDLLAYHKMNVLHWHLTEDQGWRLEIKRYPRLTEVGAWRLENGRRYGGFYTQDEVRDIVAYAKSRFVTVVPEIEMPGHAVAALAAYPEFSCLGKPLAVESSWGIFNDVLCPGKEKTFEFVQNILDEVCELFPSPDIHIGGDECPKFYWQVCPDCQSRIKQEGLKDENELQGYFTKRIDRYMQSRGRRIIGWDEILEGGVSQTAVVQSWRGLEGAVAATRQGNRVICSPWEGTYFYCPQVPEEVRINFKTLNSLEKAYTFDPIPQGLTAAQESLIVGGECCLWNEYTQQFEVEPQLFPRLCAFSEALWSPQGGRNFEDFSGRLEKHLSRLDALAVDYHKPEVRVGGWTQGSVTRLSGQLWWDITSQITEPGIYRMSFVQDSGDDEILIQWAALFEDGREISRFSQLNRSQTDMFLKYPLRAGPLKPGAVYTLRASFVSGKDKSLSGGSVWLRYFKDNGIDLWGKEVPD